ncbi:uncharacterized protein L969DRAFT_94437 [Mixia osmundae IAM 14324]|uniref:Uncharacterized protein n=1 Tax=Mixia osmundae (strain CBS 9802 / IAM 14324 / JCM 22182 / KY 12970) TaxID=764103 RepID=G7E3H0_MIXOS|nr:uncharacterized protein L969DRAFT_94437 [Mixia osmundae IAM 14324]KEI39367.1 hypothetical protein L969DRAFT_94437 [Mixia osmundae IAM 14324]GAA97380.1 hypothetical protein E5Q_04058 [Mixia osmundae IAM 14324]
MIGKTMMIAFCVALSAAEMDIVTPETGALVSACKPIDVDVADIPTTADKISWHLMRDGQTQASGNVPLAAAFQADLPWPAKVAEKQRAGEWEFVLVAEGKAPAKQSHKFKAVPC